MSSMAAEDDGVPRLATMNTRIVMMGTLLPLIHYTPVNTILVGFEAQTCTAMIISN
jgi:hypothetical protein